MYENTPTTDKAPKIFILGSIYSALTNTSFFQDQERLKF